MSTSEIILEINKLSVEQRLTLVELTIKKIREEEKKEQMLSATEALFNDYINDNELIAFSSLDQEDFNDAR